MAFGSYIPVTHPKECKSSIQIKKHYTYAWIAFSPMQAQPVLGVSKAILHGERNLVSLKCRLNRHFTKIGRNTNLVCA